LFSCAEHLEDIVNQAFRLSPARDTVVSNWGRIAPVGTAAFTGRHPSVDRLRAFASRFVPAKETTGQKLSGVAVTAGVYAAVAAVAYELASLNLAGLFHALHLNGV
jgi:S-adenosylmethionine synthetase